MIVSYTTVNNPGHDNALSLALLNRGFDKEGYAFVEVLGDSSEPTYKHGDYVIVDTNDKRWAGVCGGTLVCYMNHNDIPQLGRFEPLGNGKAYLQVLNEAYNRHRKTVNDYDQFTHEEINSMLIGKVVGHLSLMML